MSFKHKYRKLLVRHVVSYIDKGKTTSQIIEDFHVLKAITWLQPLGKLYPRILSSSALKMWV